MLMMFYNASYFNQDLCAWGAKLPSIENTAFSSLSGMFNGTACAYPSDPIRDTDGFLVPFCASSCPEYQSSSPSIRLFEQTRLHAIFLMSLWMSSIFM